MITFVLLKHLKYVSKYFVVFVGEEKSGPCRACQKKMNLELSGVESQGNMILPKIITEIKRMNHEFGKCGWDALVELLQMKNFNNLIIYLHDS